MERNRTPTVRRRVIHRGERYEYVEASYAGTDGGCARKEYIRHPGAVVIVPVLGAGDGAARGARVVLVRNFRASVGEYIWELPAGTLEARERPRRAAARELTEETGYRAGAIEPLCRFFTSPGLSDELMWAFVARGLRLARRSPEPDERMTVHVVAAAQVWRMIEGGEMMDSKSITALLVAKERGVLA